MRSRASICAPDGTVPIGEHTWERGRQNLSITVTELKTEAEVAEHEALVAEEQRARCSPWPYLLFVVVRSSRFHWPNHAADKHCHGLVPGVLRAGTNSSRDRAHLRG